MNRNYNLLETSRGPEARQREGALSLIEELVAQKSQNNGYFSNLRECAIEVPRSGALGASQMMTSRGR